MKLKNIIFNSISFILNNQIIIILFILKTLKKILFIKININYINYIINSYIKNNL